MDLGYIWLVLTNIRVEGYVVISTATFTAGLFFNQYLTNRFHKRAIREDWKLKMFAYRIGLYNDIRSEIAEFASSIQKNVHRIQDLHDKAQASLFLFPEDARLFLEGLSRRAIEWRRARSEWDPLRERAWRGEQLSPEEEEQKNDALRRKRAAEKWFLNLYLDPNLDRKLGSVFDIAPKL